jgi:hypothetical protein
MYHHHQVFTVATRISKDDRKHANVIGLRSTTLIVRPIARSALTCSPEYGSILFTEFRTLAARRVLVRSSDQVRPP